jgi:hypothetical protein
VRPAQGNKGGDHPLYVKVAPNPPAPAPAKATEKGVVWSGERFESKSELRKWLARRGIGWARWARNHPVAAGKLEPGA